MSTEESSPRPWRMVDPHYEDAGVEIFDAEGARVCKDLIAADAALIVDAVNQIENARGIARTTVNEYAQLAAERDRLRDIVRRMVGHLAALNYGYAELLRAMPDTGMAELCGEVHALIREARAALGEGDRA